MMAETSLKKQLYLKFLNWDLNNYTSKRQQEKKKAEKMDWTNTNKPQVAKCNQENYIFKGQIF